MLSTQAVRGLPRLRALGIVPCIISFSPYILMIFKVFSLSDSPVNLQQSVCKDPTTPHMRRYTTL